ncbi:MAG: EAL domain-containing protein [Methylococcaceae bacterium]|nr:EAL domain-containing protein [Methylococcaceae bacterium]
MGFKKRSLLILVVFLAISLIVLGSFRVLFFSDENHHKITDELQKIEKSSALLHEYILKHYQGMLNTLDPIRSADNINESLKQIRKLQQPRYFENNAAIVKNTDSLIIQIEQLSASLKQFIKINTQLKESLSQLPLLVANFPSNTETPSQNKTNRLAQQLVNETVLYYQWRQPFRKKKIEQLIKQLSTLSLTLPKPKLERINQLISHTKIIHHNSDLVEKNIIKLFSIKILDSIELIENQYFEIHQKRQQQSKYINISIYVLSTILLLFILKFIAMLRSTAFSLHRANSKLSHEIKQRIETENKEKQQTVFLQTVLDNISDGIVACNNEGELTLFNKAAKVIYEQEFKTIGFDDWATQYQIYDKEGKNLLEKSQLPLYKALMSEEVNNEEIVIKPKGSVQKSLLTNARPLINNNNEKFGAVICVRDISERKKIEMEMRLAATAFETHEAIIITDKDTNIIRVNQRFCDITGYSSDEVIGKQPRILSSGKHDKTFYQNLWTTLKKENYWQGEIYNRKKNGDIYLEWISISVVKDENNQISHYISHFKDISESKYQQEKIKRTADEERVLARLLQLSFKPLAEFLQLVTEEIITLSIWKNVEPKCAIFLSEKEAGETSLRLKSHYNLAPELIKSCDKVAFGTCLCGKAAETKEIIFRDCVGDEHELSFENMPPHAHYNVPILNGDKVLGVVVLYFTEDHQQQDYEFSFLERAANVLSLGISRKQAEDQVEYLAYYDSLTALPNRMLLLDRLEQSIVHHKRKNRYAALLYVDIDRFRHINDSLGTDIGDSLLQEVSDSFREVLRDDDTVARIGADEFIILLTDFSPLRESVALEVQHVIKKLQSVVAEMEIEGHKLFITLSIGVVVVTGEIDSAGMLMIQADTAMHQAKDNGRNSSQFFIAEMQELANARVEIEKELHFALKRSQIHVYYQPQVNSDNQIVGAEALVRWIHPEKGFISPVDFISIAEESGMILDIGRFVLKDACQRIREWKDIKTLDHVAVNVSPVQFSQSDFIDTVKEILSESQIDPSKLTLELTEGILVDNVEDVIEKMQQLKQLKIHFSIDDFGTGYSSLAYLTRFPLDQLKIDKSFVDEIGLNKDGEVLIETIIAMADRLSFNLIAEGVETAEQLAYLKEKGCYNYQGYYFSKPIPSSECLNKFKTFN